VFLLLSNILSICLKQPIFPQISQVVLVEGLSENIIWELLIMRIFTGQMPFLSLGQQCQSTEG